MPTDDERGSQASHPIALRVARVRAHASWSFIRKSLLLHGFSINGKSFEGVEPWVQEALTRFVETHGHDLDAMGGLSFAIPLLEQEVTRARDRQRQKKGEKRGMPLTEAMLDVMSDARTQPEAMHAEHSARATQEGFLARLVALAEGYPCAKLLLEGLDRGEGDTLARDAGFTQEAINNERKRLKRLALRAAREEGIAVPDERGGDAMEGELA